MKVNIIATVNTPSQLKCQFEHIIVYFKACFITSDPDTQLGDGIYSAYIIDMPSSSDNFDMEIVISIKSSATAASTVLKRKIPKLLPIDPCTLICPDIRNSTLLKECAVRINSE